MLHQIKHLRHQTRHTHETRGEPRRYAAASNAIYLRVEWPARPYKSCSGYANPGALPRYANPPKDTPTPQIDNWPRGVTVSTLDSESSDRGSNPREASACQMLTCTNVYMRSYQNNARWP